MPKKAFAEADGRVQTGPACTVKVNTVDHNTFQEQINSYLQGKPGRRVHVVRRLPHAVLRRSKGLAGDINDVWGKLGGDYSDALKKASTGVDGKQYFVPFYYYPWAVFYRKSVFEKNGYEVPKTLDELMTLGTQMKKDGLTPIAFGDKDGWPAMGTFDILNLRINGYDFHIELMEGKESWEDPKVAKVFDTWTGLLPLHQAGSLGRTWQEAAQTLPEEVRHVPARHCSSASSSPSADARRPRLLHLPRDRLRHRRGHARRADRRLHARRSPKNEDGAKAAAGVPRLRPRRRTST